MTRVTARTAAGRHHRARVAARPRIVAGPARLAVLLAVVALAAGCASSEQVVLLPNPDGHPSRITVTHGGTSTELSEPYQAVSVGGGRASTRRLDEAEVQRTFGAALGGLPTAPASYLLYFEVDSADQTTATSEAELRAALDDIAARPQPEVTIIGHTDRVGTVEYNDQLSRERAMTIAERIRARLTGAGLDAAAISTAGRGEREPLVPTADEVAEPQNRRVELNVR